MMIRKKQLMEQAKTHTFIYHYNFIYLELTEIKICSYL